jgi:hypothetical protein
MALIGNDLVSVIDVALEQVDVVLLGLVGSGYGGSALSNLASGIIDELPT